MAGRTTSKSDQFMESPLVVWLNTFDDYNTVKTVQDLADGILLHKVMHTIDPTNCSMAKVNRSVSGDQGLRMQNLQLLVERVNNFYISNMQQLIIASLPDIVAICNTPESEYSLDQMEKLLILLLGCAVKCEPLVLKMKAMEPIQQQALVTNIKQVTHSTELVCSIDWDDLNEIPNQQLQGLCRTAYSHLQRVAKERDIQFDTIIEVSLEKDYYKQLQSMSNGPENGLTPRSMGTPVKSSPSYNAEMLELKKKARHLQEQLDQKTDLVMDMKDELEQARLIIQKLQQDKRELAEDAKATRAYRDEIEMLKVQSSKADKLETDVVKYRQKAEDTEYLKKKIAGLKAENDLTVQTKALLEQKIEALTSRSEALDDLQEQYASTKAQLESLQQEKEMDSEKIEELLARNAHLELEFKHYEERLVQLNMELETSRVNALEATSSNDASNLSFEMSEADMAFKAKVVRLEKEAKEMEKSMESLRHAQAKCVELEKLNKKLHTQTHTDRREIIKLREEVEVLKVKASRVDKLQLELNSQRERVEESGRNSAKLKEIKSKYDIVLEAKARLEDEVESLQAKVGLTDHLKDDNASLKAQADSHQAEHDEDQKRIQELLQHNAQLELEKQICSEEMETLKSQLLQLRNKSGPHAPVTMVSPPRYSEAEMASRAKLQRLEKETQEMEKTMEALRHTQAKCSELEKGNKKLVEQAHVDQREIIRLKEELQGSKAKSVRMDKLQMEMKNQEQQLEDVDAARRKITELKQQNSLLSEARILLQEELSGLQAKLTKYSASQADNMALQVRVEAMEAELQEESLRMQELLQQNVQLELDRDKKNEELKHVSEEMMQLKLKQGAPGHNTISPVHKPMSEEDLANRTKVLRLERDNRELERSLEVERQTSQRTSSEMERMNRKLTATIHADKKEIARLKEELRRERAQATSGGTGGRTKSVSEETDFSQAKQMQELENKFKDAYSQSLSTKDERIQVLEKRVEEASQDNAQLREELSSLKRHYERLKAQYEGGGRRGSVGSGSPQTSPARARQQDRAGEDLKAKMGSLSETNTTLTKNLADARHHIQQLETSGQRQADKVQMLEKLSATLEEEKKTLLTQLNKQLEKNQDLLVKTLETKDVALEDERIFNDRLTELERDKQRLQEQLVAHRRDTLTRDMEMQYWKKTGSSNKSKNILKKGLKKLKGKIQQGKSYKFDYPEGGPPMGLAGSSHTIGAVGSMGSIGSSGSAGNLGGGYHVHDGSMSSSQSISSSNSKHSGEEGEEVEGEEGSASTVDSSVGPNLIPRAATFDGSPFLRQRNKGRGGAGSVNLPGMGVVKLRHGTARPQFASPTGAPNFDPDRIPDDLISLEDFLAESEKHPNRRRVMELKRASLVIGTPPATPRNSMLITPGTSSSQMFDLQEFLSNMDPNDVRSKRNTIHEVEENDPDQLFMQEQAAQYKASQHSISQHSKSSSSLHSAHSVSSVNRGGGVNEQEQVIANPAAVSSNFNNNNNNNNAKMAAGSGLELDLQDMSQSSQQSGEDSLTSPLSASGVVLGILSPSPTTKPRSLSNSPHIRPTNQNTLSVAGSGHSPVAAATSGRTTGGFITSKQRSNTVSAGLGYDAGKQPLAKKTFHKSSGSVLEKGKAKGKSSGGGGGRPWFDRKKAYKSSTDISTNIEDAATAKRGSLKRESNVGPLGLDLSDLTELCSAGDMLSATTTSSIGVNPPPPQASAASTTTQASRPTAIAAAQPIGGVGGQREEIDLASPHFLEASQTSSQDSGDLLTWEDFLDSTSPSHHPPPGASSSSGRSRSPQPPSRSPRQGPQSASPHTEPDGEESIWLNLGSV